MCLGESNHSTWRYSGSLVINSLTQKNNKTPSSSFLPFRPDCLLAYFRFDARSARSRCDACLGSQPGAFGPGLQGVLRQGQRILHQRSRRGEPHGLCHPGARCGDHVFLSLHGLQRDGRREQFLRRDRLRHRGGIFRSSGSSGSWASSRCFIATAAFGSGLAPEVLTLREFRDRYLLTNGPGQAFVDWYYRVSPPAAAFIAEHESLKTAVRWGLTPVVCAVKYPAAALAMILLIPAVVIVRKREKKCQ